MPDFRPYRFRRRRDPTVSPTPTIPPTHANQTATQFDVDSSEAATIETQPATPQTSPIPLVIATQQTESTLLTVVLAIQPTNVIAISPTPTTQQTDLSF